jgi:L-ascorbate metabolism protein UlaG (beta-lactamase superfamily)/glycosyltransferase involved in cell wall biosynthesis
MWPKDISDADLVFITHEHLDHCDPLTLPEIHKSAPKAKFIGPYPVVDKLITWGISKDSIILATTDLRNQYKDEFEWQVMPAAHPNRVRNSEGYDAFVGYLIDWQGHKIYHSGDTSITDEILHAAIKVRPIHTAILPVNERNFFKERRGIIGNMTLREAFTFAEEMGANNLIPIHWDMFAGNSVGQEEIECTYKLLKPKFNLLLKPTAINKRKVGISIVIRTLNEGKYLNTLLAAIAAQELGDIAYEVIIVDSGSSDETLNIAEKHGCRVLSINKSEFSFGRSLNIGCDSALGEVIVMISGHCIPTDRFWLVNLTRPIFEGKVDYAYGRQSGGVDSALSECEIFEKYFPDKSALPQQGFFCNNANSAILKVSWQKHRFDEGLTGLEDMELAKRLLNSGGRIGYIADASVFHYHHESASQIRHRFEREALALQVIMPQVHISLLDIVWFITAGIVTDLRTAIGQGRLTVRSISQILVYRVNQYWGSYLGNHNHRRLSQQDKLRFFFPMNKI